MAYAKEIYEMAERELGARRLAAQQRAAALHARMRRDERVCEQEMIMASSAKRLATLILNRSDRYEEEFEAIKAENRAAKARIVELMREAGEDATDFEPQYTCKLCDDTGYVDGRSCACRQALLKEYAAGALCKLTGMKPQSFDELDLSFYSDTYDERLGCSPREHMQSIFQTCRRYADGFNTARPSLLLYGGTGTGKTHVSLSIAAGAIEREASVIYGPVQTLLRAMEAEHFGRATGNTEQALIDCDLLILDDLGTEFSSPFYTGALYTVINGRMLASRPTIVSTNLDSAAIYDHYGEQLASRLMGHFERLWFVGSDIRQQKIARRKRHG